jgi:hypothetical protein
MALAVFALPYCRCTAPFDDLSQLAFKCDAFGLAGFRVLSQQVDHIIGKIGPAQRLKRALAPADDEIAFDKIVEIFRQVLNHRVEMLGLEKALPFVAYFGEVQNEWRRCQFPCPDGQLIRLPKQLSVPVTGRRAISLAAQFINAL